MQDTETKITVSSINDINSFNLERIITVKGTIDSMSAAEAQISAKLRQSYENDLQAMAPQTMMFPGLHPMAMMATAGEILFFFSLQIDSLTNNVLSFFFGGGVFILYSGFVFLLHLSFCVVLLQKIRRCLFIFCLKRTASTILIFLHFKSQYIFINFHKNLFTCWFYFDLNRKAIACNENESFTNC